MRKEIYGLFSVTFDLEVQTDLIVVSHSKQSLLNRYRAIKDGRMPLLSEAASTLC